MTWLTKASCPLAPAEPRSTSYTFRSQEIPLSYPSSSNYTPMRYLFPLLALLALAPSTAIAQSSCFHVAAWVSPDLMRCQQVGQTQLGIPIWLCC